tara:strand:- start:34112 stop:34378 length:267 start_codon:yes stop_codon:yes gene_type:complete
MTEKEKTPTPGRAWDNHSTYKTFEDAGVAREKLKSMWHDESIEGMEVKVRLRSDGTYLIKTRSPAPEKKTKKTKTKKKSKKKPEDNNG